MFQKLKDYIKKDWKFILLIIAFMVVNFAIVTLNYGTESVGIHINGIFKTLYSTLSFIIIFVVGGFLTFKVRKADRDDVKLEKLFLWVAIPIGLIMCFAKREMMTVTVALGLKTLFEIIDLFIYRIGFNSILSVIAYALVTIAAYRCYNNNTEY